MTFTAPLTITPNYQAGGYDTCSDFSFDIGFKGSGLRVTVPAGFNTDLASIPQCLWWLLQPFDPQYAAAAVLHDYLRRWSVPREDGSFERFDEGTSDAIFYEAMRILGVPVWKAAIMFIGVRIAGAW